MASSALMGLFVDDQLQSDDPKTRVKALISRDSGRELEAYLKTFSEAERRKILRSSLTKFGDNTAMRQAIHERSYDCIRSLILLGVDVSFGDGATSILSRNILLFQDEDDAYLAYVILRSYNGTLRDLPFATQQDPKTCISTLGRSHPTALKLIPILALMGMFPESAPVLDDARIRTIKEGKRNQDWLKTYLETRHHHSLKNGCRIVIRKMLRVPDEERVEELRLPRRLKQYLLLEIPI